MGWVFSEIYFGFSIHILYLWGKKREKSQRSTLPCVAELKLRLGRVKVCSAQSWSQTQAQRLDVVMMSRLGSVEGERKQPSCAHPAAGSL